jgi:ADP-ribose pyrophosphatase YjhB (NUDIX family)
MQAKLFKLAPALRARWNKLADQAPVSPRLPLRLHGVMVGSVAQSLVHFFTQTGVNLDWHESMDREGRCWHLPNDPAPTFAAIRQALQQHGYIVWPSLECLSILDADGQDLGPVPRDLARFLGLNTHSVHIAGWQAEVAWVQERANNKAEDPGLLDTMVGGTVAWAENPLATLEREIWEEAGLSTHQLDALTSYGTIELKKPSLDPQGWGYQIETVHCFSAQVVQGAQPVNHDGEVAAFHPFSSEELRHALEADRFTLAATGVYLRVTQAMPASAVIKP